MSIKCTVDAQGLVCPLPLLKARQGLSHLQIGECLEVLSTDGGSIQDFHRMIKLTGNTLVLFEEDAQVYRYIIRKGKKI